MVEIDVRVSTVPTPLGEDVIMKILYKKSWSFLRYVLDMVGFSMHDIKLCTDALHLPDGIILHVGPTGSGKKQQSSMPL